MTKTKPPSPDITKRFGEFSIALRFEDLSPEVIAEARNGLLDTLGVALVGSKEQATRMILKVSTNSKSDGAATVLGTDTLATPGIAAMVNGYAAHALDYDDTQHRIGSHMSAPVIPAALVAAEMFHRSGKDLLTAYVAGFEVACRLGRVAGFSFHLSKRGVHSTGFLGHFGAAAAAGKLVGLDALQMNRSFGIVGGFASGLVKSFGTMGKAQNAGNAAQNAVLSALLAKEGFTGPEEIFDGERNIFAITDAKTDSDALLDGLGREFEITHNTLKVYACAGWRNPIIEAAILLAATHKLQPKDIKKVNVWACVDVVTRLPNYSQPGTGLEAKFSAEYAAAVALVDGAGGVAQFTDERVADPALVELTSRITLAADEKLGPFQIRISIHTTDGRELTHFVPAQKGDPRNPLSWDELVAKFRANAAAVLPDGQVQKLIAMLRDLDTVKDVADLTRLCRTSGSAA